MGCTSSKLDDLPAVALCRERCAFLDAAIQQRYQLSESHVAYTNSLRGIGHSLHLFINHHHRFVSSGGANGGGGGDSPRLNLPPHRKGDPDQEEEEKSPPKKAKQLPPSHQNHGSGSDSGHLEFDSDSDDSEDDDDDDGEGHLDLDSDSLHHLSPQHHLGLEQKYYPYLFLR